MNLADLRKPFPVCDIKWRVGRLDATGEAGIALAYIDARDVMMRLDSVCEAENWQAEYPFPGCCRIGIRTIWRDVEDEEYFDDDGKPIAYKKQYTHAGWVWKSSGAGKTQFEGEKGQYSEAFKRAGVLWGIGQYLYDFPNRYWPVEKNGDYAYFSDKTIKELNKFLNDWQKTSVPKQERIEFANQARDLMSKGDEFGLKEIFDEYDADQRIQLWPEFSSTERSAIKALME